MIRARHAVWILLLVSACFHPTYDHPACSPSGECPNGLICSPQQSCEAPGQDSPDAAADSDSVLCPASYNAALPGPSHYRLIPDGHRAWEQSDACNQDLPGATHLVVIETAQELAAVAAYIKPGLGTAGDSIWIGAVQLNTAISPRDAWLGFDGNPLIDGWGGSDPNDNDNNESNHEEQFVRMTRTQPNPYFIDSPGGDSFGALCECDGKPIDPAVAAVIDGYRP